MGSWWSKIEAKLGPMGMYICIPRTHLTSVLIGKDHILGGWRSKIEVTQVLG